MDIIIEIGLGIVLIERANPPFGLAIPGGFVDYGESLENAARRAAFEETGLKVELLHQFHTYFDPSREILANIIFLQYLLLRPLELQKPVQVLNKPGF